MYIILTVSFFGTVGYLFYNFTLKNIVKINPLVVKTCEKMYTVLSYLQI